MKGRTGPALLAATLVALPVLIGIGYSVAGALGLVGPGRGEGPARIARVLSDRPVWTGLAWSLWTALAATVLAFAGAAALAFAFRGRTRIDGIARFLAIAPLPVPHLAAAVLGVVILGQSGVLARFARAFGLITEPADMPALIYDTAGIGFILSMAWKELPFLALLAMTLVAREGRAAEEAARTLGAGSWRTFRDVTWPMLWRGLLPGATAAFVFVAGTWEAAALLAPSRPLPLPVLQYERHTASDLSLRGDGYVIALVMFAVAIAAVSVHEIIRARREAT